MIIDKIDINKLVIGNNTLIKKIPNKMIIIGKINYINIKYKYNKLDLSRVSCKRIKYINQEKNSIKIINYQNH